MATIAKRRSKWRVRETERSIGLDLDPSAKRFTGKDTFSSLIQTHINDLLA